MSDTELNDSQRDLAQRVRQGITRKQVAFGRENVTKLGRRQEIALVWITDDLARNQIYKLVRDCEKLELPVVIFGQSEEIGEITGEPSVKVYLVKRNFAGINTVMHNLRASGDLDA